MKNLRKPEHQICAYSERVPFEDGAEPEKLLKDYEHLLQLYNCGEINLSLVDLWMMLDRLLSELSNLPEWIAAEDRDDESDKRSLFRDYYATCQSIACLLSSRIMGDN